MPPSRLQLFAVAALLFIALSHTAAAADSTQGGYADRTSVVQGGTISFHIATTVSPFAVQIVNLAHPTQVLATVGGLTSTASDCTGLWENGCGWPSTMSFAIPRSWPSGYYAAQFPTSGGKLSAIFVVRESSPGSTSPVLVVSPTNTYTAYNQYAGKSVYDTLSTNSQRAHIVSFDRPYADGFGLGRYPLWEEQFVDWMTAEGRGFEVVTDDDLADPTLLSHYKTVVLVGHSEYWTLEARNSLQAFSNSGGNVAIFGGNTLWWQARTDPQSRQFICYKDASLDPESAVDPSRVTVNWYSAPVFNPENSLTGTSFRNAEYANRASNNEFTPLPESQRTPYTITDAGNWVFSGTGVTNGQTFAQAAAGIEIDGAIFNVDAGGVRTVDGSDGSPLNYSIVATLPGDLGYGTIGWYANSHGGAVFNAGTRDWTHGLAADAVVQQVTRNVLDRFANGQPFTYQRRTSDYKTRDLFNVPSPVAGVLPGWRGSLQGGSVSTTSPHEGPSSLQLAGAPWTQLLRNFSPSNTKLAAAGVNLWVNADQLTQTPGWSIPLVSLVDDNDGDAQYATVEVQILAAGKSIRLSNFTRDGTRMSSTSWVVLPTGWQQVSVSWRAPGMTELIVTGQPAARVYNSQSGQGVTAVMLQYPGSGYGFQGSISIDELQVIDVVGPASASTSTISASPTTVVANGSAASAIAIQLEDASSAKLPLGGDAVVIRSSAGILSPVTDNGDGTYSATLTSTKSATANVTATVNGEQMAGTVTVHFVPGPPAAMALAAPPNMNPGAQFGVDVTVRDANGNVISGYSGTVHLTSTDTSASLPADYTFQPSDAGAHHFDPVTLRSFGTQTITATDTASPSVKGSATVSVRATTTAALSSSANPANPGAALTLTATITSGTPGPAITGSVEFKDGSTTLGSGTIAGGKATLTTTLASGPHAITAVYSGDADYLPSTSPSLTQYVTLPAPSTTAAANGTSSVTVSWSGVANAAQYVVERSSNHGAFVTLSSIEASRTSISDSVSSSATYLYRVHAIDGGGNPGATSVPSAATTIVFKTDPAGIIRASHFTDLRAAIDTFRTSAGLGAFAYTNAVAMGMPVRAVDLTEMRTAVQQARTADGLPSFAFTDSIAAGTTNIKAIHLRELQQAIGAVAWP